MPCDFDAVDHHGGDALCGKVTSEPRIELLLSEAHEAATDRALARAVRGEFGREVLDRTSVAAGRDAEGDLLDGALVQRVLVGERGPARQLDLPAVLAHTRLAHRDGLPAHHQPPLAATPALGPLLARAGVRGPAEGFAVLFEQHIQRLHALAHHEREQVLAHELGKHQRALGRCTRSDFLPRLLADILPHGGPSSGLSTPRFPRGQKGPPLQISTLRGTSPRLVAAGDFSFAYTPDGYLRTKTNILTGEVTTYAYDTRGNLVRVDLPSGDSIEYVHDGARRRVAKKRNGIVVRRWIYRDALRIAAELDATGASAGPPGT